MFDHQQPECVALREKTFLCQYCELLLRRPEEEPIVLAPAVQE